MGLESATRGIASYREIAGYLRAFGNVKLPAEARAKAFWIAHEMIYRGTDKLLHKNPWAEKMVYEMCAERFVGFSGCASSGKSTVSAAFVIMFWWSNPRSTKVIVTSTDLKGARNRIWGQIKEFFMAAQIYRAMPGKLVDSLGSIVLDIEEGGAYSNRAGIELFAGEPKKSSECIQKWIGLKNERVMLILDEMPYLGPQLLSAAFSNLVSNPYFSLVGLGNFSSKMDPFGEFLTPKDGWDSVDIDDEEWETLCQGQKGKCVRFDGSKSPNVVAGENLYDQIYSVELFERHRKLGENNPRFWQMCRSFPAPVGIGNNIYSEAHFDKAYGKEPVWMEQPVMVAALDPSFTNGGDRSQMIAGKLGRIVGGKRVLYLSFYQELYADASNSADPRDYQIARAFRDKCVRLGVSNKNAAVDSTGSGSSFHAIVGMEWKPVVGVMFGGAASERPAHEGDGRPGYEVYYNRVAELWDQGKEYFVKGMVCGVTKELANELCTREYDRLGQSKIKIESKKDMKRRIGRSPDLADSFAILLELCRIVHNFYPDWKGGSTEEYGERLRGNNGYTSGLASLNEIGTLQDQDEQRRTAEEEKSLSPYTPASLVGWALNELYGGGDESDVDRFLDFRTGP